LSRIELRTEKNAEQDLRSDVGMTSRGEDFAELN
jgi:hypothetical protein